MTTDSDTSTKEDENKKLEKDEKSAWKLSDSISNPKQMKIAVRRIARWAFQSKVLDGIKDGKTVGYLDSGSDTTSIAGDAWIIESLTKRKVLVTSYDSDTTRKNIPIGTCLTAIDLPDDTTIIIRANEAMVLGEKANMVLGERANTLFSESQMEDNGVIQEKQKMDLDI